MMLMFDYLKNHHMKKQPIHQFLDEHDPIDQQILALLATNEITVDVIPLDNPPQKQKKHKS
jgi:hypothetical protein